MTAYYNEIDPFACAWLQALIDDGQIAPGVVDTRDIRDVTPSDLEGFTQCHFFAGIGGWSLALRLAGWPDDRPIWTGSCPCQPFSAAGAGGGFADERHLWPAWHWLIAQCRPAVVTGEQVASAAGRVWFDLVSTDLEGLAYAVGASDLCAAGVGAPHIRQRLYWIGVADADHARLQGRGRPELRQRADQRALGAGGASGGMADRDGARRGARGASEARDGRDTARIEPAGFRVAGGGLEHASSERWQRRQGAAQGGVDHGATSRRAQSHDGSVGAGESGTRGFWSPADWISCSDGKARPVEPGTFPLATGVPARMGRLRGYGNSIVPQVGAAFIDSYLSLESGI